MEIGKIFREIRRSQGRQSRHAANEKPNAPLEHPQKQKGLLFQKQSRPQQNHENRCPAAQMYGTKEQSLHIFHVAFFLFVEEIPFFPVHNGIYHQVIPFTLEVSHHFIGDEKQIVHFHGNLLQHMIFSIFLFKIAIVPIDHSLYRRDERHSHQTESDHQPHDMIQSLHFFT